MKNTDILLIYPQLGSLDEMVMDIPLSLIYAATDSVKKGFNVKIIDLRLVREGWEKLIDEILIDGCALAGISVMTGNPIKTSLTISRYIKEKYKTRIVWGGPHPTILPQQTLENPAIDFVIRDWGSKALCQLTQHLRGERVAKQSILGLGYKENGKIILNPPQTCFETLDFHDLPYDLVDMSGKRYSRFKTWELVLPIYTSLGCPYRCNFCMAPATQKNILGKRWIAYDIEYVLNHIEFLSSRYKFSRIQVYDDTSFVDLDRMRDLLTEYIRRGFNKKYKIDFRGARVNELDKMDDNFFRLLVEANVEIMLVGMESGSPRTLELMKKDITVEQIIAVNRKFAKFPSLKPNYNFFCGIPGETFEDLVLTKSILIQLTKEHPGCYLGIGARWKPIPGSVLTDIAVKDYGLKLPASLEGWVDFDSVDGKEIVHPWFTPKMRKMIDLLALAGAVLDGKAKDLSVNMGPVAGKALYCLILFYRPFLRLRLKFNFTAFLIEMKLYKFFLTNFGRLLSHGNKE